MTAPITILAVHSNDLPCAACSWGVKHGELTTVDFCGGIGGCGHFHTESDCPIERRV